MDINGLKAVTLLATLCTTAGCSTPRVYGGEPAVRDRMIVPSPAIIAHPAVVVIGDVAALMPIVMQLRIILNERRGKRVGAALALEGLDVAKEFQQELVSELKKLGEYDVATVSASRAAPKDFELWPNEQELPSGHSNDCFVDVLLVYGFVSPVTGADYEPYMVVNLKVVRGEDLYASHVEKFFYNFLGRNIEVPPSVPLPSWKNGAALEADVKGARDAFRNAIGDLSEFISRNLQAGGYLGKC